MIPIGKAKIVEEGNDISVITYGAMVHTALDASRQLEESGISLEIVDLRTLMPMDKETVFNSVKKTNRVIVLYEATRSGGVGSDVSAIIAEEVFDYLDSPILRVSALDTPVPYSPPMEEYYLPQVEDVVRAAKKLIAY